jgi:hypothetical protein
MWTQQGSIMVLWFAAMGLLLSGLVLALAGERYYQVSNAAMALGFFFAGILVTALVFDLLE